MYETVQGRLSTRLSDILPDTRVDDRPSTSFTVGGIFIVPLFYTYIYKYYMLLYL